MDIEVDLTLKKQFHSPTINEREEKTLKYIIT